MPWKPRWPLRREPVGRPLIDLTRLQAEADTRFRQWWAEFNEKARAGGEPEKTTNQAAVAWWGGTVDENGNVISTANRDAVWDWWVVGGRFAGEWVLKPGAARALDSSSSSFGYTEEIKDARRTDAARKGRIRPESITHSYAYLDLDGKWHSPGRVLWFGQSKGRDESPRVGAGVQPLVQSLA